LFEEITGDRMMYGYFRVGGLGWDVTEDFEERARHVVEEARQGIADIDGLLTNSEVLLARGKGISAISAADAINWGISGPLLRACGVKHDLRRAEPYSLYDRLKFEIPVGENGDVFDRYWVRLEEMRQSTYIIEQCLEQMPKDGPIIAPGLKRILRPPVGEIYMRAENPRGEYGVYIVSKGAEKPYRLKIRSPCFSNLAALRTMTVGHYVADAIIILGSIDIILGEVDR
jgi:NADH-quinone oxidoreductase subunit D